MAKKTAIAIAVALAGFATVASYAQYEDGCSGELERQHTFAGGARSISGDGDSPHSYHSG
uniref:Translocating peptide n=1 Tax=Escherichia coli TaxID=562 RepID=UPI00111186B0|nr:Chain B, Translocating peptide [Escherichia coli]